MHVLIPNISYIFSVSNCQNIQIIGPELIVYHSQEIWTKAVGPNEYPSAELRDGTLEATYLKYPIRIL